MSKFEYYSNINWIKVKCIGYTMLVGLGFIVLIIIAMLGCHERQETKVVIIGIDKTKDYVTISYKYGKHSESSKCDMSKYYLYKVGDTVTIGQLEN